MGYLYPDSIRRANLARLKNWDKIVETKEAHNSLLLERKINDIKYYENNNKKDVEFIMRHDYYPEIKVNEDNTFVPRFNIKKYTHPLFSKFPPNKELKYSRDLMVMAINYGMILQIQYRGAKDDFVQGRQRVIYPMVVGTSAKGMPLLRAYHLKGWSLSENGKVDKVWRMFRTDRILTMSFTGHFFRLPPSGYNMKDKGMAGGIIAAADFSVIRNNQKSLIQKNLIQNKEQISLNESIEIDKTDTKLDLSEPFANPNINETDKKLIRMTFMKNVATNHYIAILGALGEKNKIVRVYSRDKYLGQYKVLKWIMGDALGKPHMKNLDNQTEFDLYIFIKKLEFAPDRPTEEVKPEEVAPKKPTKFEEMSKKINQMGKHYREATEKNTPKEEVKPEIAKPAKPAKENIPDKIKADPSQEVKPTKPTKFEEMTNKINQMGKNKGSNS